MMTDDDDNNDVVLIEMRFLSEVLENTFWMICYFLFGDFSNGSWMDFKHVTMCMVVLKGILDRKL